MQLLNISNQDINLSADQLEAKYSPAGGGQHPTFTRADWIIAVDSDETISGYWQWVNGEIQSLLDDTLVGSSASNPAVVNEQEGIPAVPQLQFVAVIRGTVDVNDGEPGSHCITERQLGEQISCAIETMIGNGGLTWDSPAVVDSHAVSIQVAKHLGAAHQTINMLREKGYSVTVFNPEELGQVDPYALQQRLVELSAQEIDNLQPQS
ncbi:TPA: hypothetical protein ACP32N_005033 [Pseudomonas aeruginosa]